MFEDPVEDTRCVLHCEMKNEGFKTASKVQYVARVGNFIDNGADYTGALQILKVIFVMITCGRISVSKAALMAA